MTDVDIMLLGLTGAGKSASGNTIIGVKDTFREDFSPEAVTRFCQSEYQDRQRITVIDTVGLSDTTVKIKDAQTQIEKMLQETYYMDVFLLVIKLGTFTEENSKVVKWIQDNFGAKLLKHTIVLFTHGDQLHGPIEDYLGKCKALRSIVDQCSGRFHVFNNKDKDPSQVTELLDKINKMVMMNGNSRYTEQDYKNTQENLLFKKRVTRTAGGVVVCWMASSALAEGQAVAATIAAAGGVVLAAGAVATVVCFLARKIFMYSLNFL